MKILITGGLGYIGSHTCIALLSHGHDVVVVDNLCNGSKIVLNRIEKIVGRQPSFIEADVRDEKRMVALLQQNGISAVIHFAALKEVAESVTTPLAYYNNNVAGSIALLGAMSACHIKTLVFSSSATVYGIPASFPVREDFPRKPINPYGYSKMVVEDMLAHLATSDPDWRIATLRYFNPVGAHESGWIGDDPRGVSTNLMPSLLQVISGHRPELEIFGSDYLTRDGTCVRDYIHVQDVAEAHLAALTYLNENPGNLIVNLGTGHGVSVLEMCLAMEKAADRPVPRRIVGRREGDAPEYWSDPQLARTTLGWYAKRGLRLMCEDALRWQKQNPAGNEAFVS